jgi:hypothetical protein
MFKDLFGKKPTPEELVKKWRLEIRKEIRGLEKNIQCMFLSSIISASFELIKLLLSFSKCTHSYRNGRKQSKEIH